MGMSLRVNPQKKALFEQDETRPAKRPKTNSSPPPNVAPGFAQPLSNLSNIQDPPLLPKNQAETRCTSRLFPKLDTFVINNTPRAPKITNKIFTAAPSNTADRIVVPSTEHIFGRSSTVVPPQSSVPSLTTDAETSDDDTASDPDGQCASNTNDLAKPTASYQGASLSSKRTLSGHCKASQPNYQAADGLITGPSEILPEYEKSSRTSKVPNYEVTHDCNDLTRLHSTSTIALTTTADVLYQACAALQEMETGQMISFTAHHHIGNETSFSKVDLRKGPNHTDYDPLQGSSAVADDPMMSVFNGVIRELVTNSNQGHGLSFLPPNIAQHQHLHSQRFIECLRRVLVLAEPKINCFLSSEHADALNTIYKFLERRLPDADIPPPTPPPGHMVVKHVAPQPHFRLVPHGTTPYASRNTIQQPPGLPSSFSAPVVLSTNAPLFPKLAPKQGHKPSNKAP